MLINITAMTLQRGTFSLKMTRSYGSKDMVGKHLGKMKIKLMKAWKEETICFLGVLGSVTGFCTCASEKEEG